MATYLERLHEAMAADRQRDMRDKAAHHRRLLDAEAALARPSAQTRLRGWIAAVLVRAFPRPRRLQHGVGERGREGVVGSAFSGENRTLTACPTPVERFRIYHWR